MSESLETRNGRTVFVNLYGDPDGFPVIFQSGSPGTREKRADVDRAARQAGVLLVAPDRPGYGGSTRQPGRSVADVVEDVAAVAEAHGWAQVGVAGGSGGGPHALACAALLPERVTRCAVMAGISPPDTSGAEPSEDEPDPRRNLTSWLAAHDPTRLRREIVETGQRFFAAAEAGGPEFPGEAGRALDDPLAMARLRATFVDGVDGWYDDNVAFAQPWGFDLAQIVVPVSLRFGGSDERSRTYAALLNEQIPHAVVHELQGGHVLDGAGWRDLLAWVRG